MLVRSMSSVGLELGDIRPFLVTHAHRDHYTQAVALPARRARRSGSDKQNEPLSTGCTTDHRMRAPRCPGCVSLERQS